MRTRIRIKGIQLEKAAAGTVLGKVREMQEDIKVLHEKVKPQEKISLLDKISKLILLES